MADLGKLHAVAVQVDETARSVNPKGSNFHLPCPGD